MSAGNQPVPDSSSRSAAPLVVAACAVAGAVVAVYPQHTVSVLRVLAVTAVVAVALTSSVAAIGLGGHTPGEVESVFERPTRRPKGRPDPPGLAVIRSSLCEVRLPEGQRLSRGVERRLRAVALAAVERAGIDLADPEQAGAVRSAVTPATWAVLATLTSSGAEPATVPAAVRYRAIAASDTAAGAEEVHAVLDDLERLDRLAPMPASPAPAVPPQSLGGDR